MIEVWLGGKPIPIDEALKKLPLFMDLAEIKSRNPIERVVGEIVALNKKGMGRCPFHEEKTPSFAVFANTQRYKCFGCGASGDVIDFIRATHNVGLPEAAKILEGNRFNARVISVPIRKPEPVRPEIKAGYEKLFNNPPVDYPNKVPRGTKVNHWMSLGAAWSEKKDAWMLPFRNAECEIIGFQFRSLTGFKWAMEGSSLGLFIPRIKVQKEVFIAEGAGDCAALRSLGVYAIARPAAYACHDMVAEFIRNQKIEQCVIVADADHAGRDSAEKLKLKLPNSRIIVPPNGKKDIREAVIAGLTRESFLEYVTAN